MSLPYVGEIRLFAGNFPPNGWAFCDGQLLSIAENEVLFELIGTTYGGDGQVTYALPDMRGRVPVHQGTGQSSYVIGQSGGVENVTLSAAQMPAHTHGLRASTQAAKAANDASNAYGSSTSANYRHADRADGRGHPRQRRRRPVARQHGPVHGAELHHLVVRRLPLAELTGAPHGRPIRG